MYSVIKHLSIQSRSCPLGKLNSVTGSKTLIFFFSQQREKKPLHGKIMTFQVQLMVPLLNPAPPEMP